MATFSDGTDAPLHSQSNEFRPIRGSRQSRNDNFRDYNQHSTGYYGSNQYYGETHYQQGYNTHNEYAYVDDTRRYESDVRRYDNVYYEGGYRGGGSSGRAKRGRGGRSKRGTGRGGGGWRDQNFASEREGEFYEHTQEVTWSSYEHASPRREKESRGRRQDYGLGEEYGKRKENPYSGL